MPLLQQVVLKLNQLKRTHPQKLITSNRLHLKVLGGSASAEPAKPTKTKPGSTDGKSESGEKVTSSSPETGDDKGTDKKESGKDTEAGKMTEVSLEKKIAMVILCFLTLINLFKLLLHSNLLKNNKALIYFKFIV